MGGVSPIKGFSDGLRALAMCPSRSWDWTIVGSLDVDRAHVAALVQLRRELELDGMVHLVGQQDHDWTMQRLQQSDALLIPSYTENAPLVALEALAAGVPVVGYEVGGLPDLVRDNEEALLAPLLDIQGLGARLRQLIEDRSLWERLARAARVAALKLPTWAEAARDFAIALAAEPLSSAATPRTDVSSSRA
jgi:glycosyltransferase involved in cell wall biosynthesis